MSDDISAAILAVVGHSGSGKTTWLERAIPRLQARGLKVAVLKHDAHRIELDRPGKDTYRLREAGADAIAIASQDLLFSTVRPPAQPSVFDLIERAFHGADLDLILLEGYSTHPFPRVEVLHPDRAPRCDPRRDEVVAWVQRAPAWRGAPVPVFPADEVEVLLDFLISKGLVPRRPAVTDVGLSRAGDLCARSEVS